MRPHRQNSNKARLQLFATQQSKKTSSSHLHAKSGSQKLVPTKSDPSSGCPPSFPLAHAPPNPTDLIPPRLGLRSRAHDRARARAPPVSNPHPTEGAGRRGERDPRKGGPATCSGGALGFWGRPDRRRGDRAKESRPRRAPMVSARTRGWRQAAALGARGRRGSVRRGRRRGGGGGEVGSGWVAAAAVVEGEWIAGLVRAMRRREVLFSFLG
jgi:hypothetical protein